MSVLAGERVRRGILAFHYEDRGGGVIMCDTVGDKHTFMLFGLSISTHHRTSVMCFAGCY